ncbi:hypothetical protein DRJ25_02950 [Candidatus Woesearchaeota archaeon]|nr:MAG: hypothetical protein DRJ25_02950 [Candidatus Woesearchaeota archaeon]
MEQLTKEQKDQIRQQCIFCQIIDGKVAAKKVYEDEKVVALLDINPANPGHILLLPKDHIAIMPQMDDSLIGYMAVIAKRLSQSILRALHAQGTTIFIANGTAAGQRAPHFMMHIIPRMEDDNIGLKPEMKKQSEEEIAQVHAALFPAIKKVLGKAIEPATKPKKELEIRKETKNAGRTVQTPGAQVTNPKLDAITDLLTKK